jgi:hypothetical protein
MANTGYPDPQYHIETQVGITYGTHIETARQVEGVLPNNR